MATKHVVLDLTSRLMPGPGRRAVLLAGLALPAAPALAQPRQQGHGRAGGRQANPLPVGSPATTMLGPFDTPARQAIILDFDTDTVLLEKNADERMAPSSMSKLMTLYAAFQKLKEGQLQLDQPLTASERAYRMGGSRMFIQIGTTATVESLIRGVIVHSGNDACVVLAEGVSGSEQ